MSTIKLFVTKQSIICLDGKYGHRFESKPSITIGEGSIITDVGGANSRDCGIVYWPINLLPMSDENSLMFIKILQHSLRELYSLRKGWWSKFFTLSPILEVHLSTDLISLETWFHTNANELGVRAIKFVHSD